MRKEIKIFIASSIDEFEIERLRLKNFINDLSRKFPSQGYDIDIVPLGCEEMSAVTTMEAQQERINQELLQSQFCYVILGKEAGKYTVEEYDLAVQQYSRTGEPRVIVSIRKQPAGIEDSESIKAFISHRFEKQKHYTNRFEHIDSIKVTIILELLNANMLHGKELRVENGTAWIDTTSLEGLVDLSKVPLYDNNEVLKMKYQDLSDLHKKRSELVAKNAKNPENLSLAKALIAVDKSIQTISDEINSIENSILDLMKKILSIDRVNGISERCIQAAEALESGDYDTAEAILSGDQWRDDIKAAADSLAKAKKIKAAAEERIASNTELIKQEISSQRLLINILKSRGINDNSAKQIDDIYAIIVPIALKWHIDLDVIAEYATFLYDQSNNIKAIEIITQLIKQNDLPDLILCQCYSILGKAHRSQNHLKDVETYGRKLLSVSLANAKKEPAYQWYEAEAYYLLTASQKVGNSKLAKYGDAAVAITKKLESVNKERALMIQF